jgi:TonB family protein
VEPPPVPPTVLMSAPAASKAAAPAPPRPASRPAAAVKTAEIPAELGPAGAARAGAGRTLLLAGGALAVLLAVVVAGAFVLMKGSDDVAATQPAPSAAPTAAPVRRTPRPAPVPTADVAAVTGLLRVVTQPAGAAVTVNGVPRGSTPLDVAELALGAHEVKVDLRGFAPAVQKVVLTAEAPQVEVNLALSRSTPATGMAEIYSNPSAALVRIDGIAVGQTPLRQPMRVGGHSVEVVKEGYEDWSGTFEVQGRGTARVDAVLRSMAPATPTPEPVDTARVYTSGEVDTQPRRVSGGSAPYPTNAPRLRPGRDVTVGGTFVVAEDGAITELKITESAGEVVDEAVIAAVRNWKYTPGARRGVKVKVRVAFKQTFRAG